MKDLSGSKLDHSSRLVQEQVCPGSWNPGLKVLLQLGNLQNPVRHMKQGKPSSVSGLPLLDQSPGDSNVRATNNRLTVSNTYDQ